METLSIILLCVFIPVTVLLSICLLCIHSYWKRKWKSITKENDIEAKGDIKIGNQSKENVKHTLRFQGRLEDAQQYDPDTTAAEAEKRQRTRNKKLIFTEEKALQTTCPEFVDKCVGVDYAVSDKCIQSDEVNITYLYVRGPSHQDPTFVADEKLGGRKKKQKKKSKATKRSIDVENQDGAKQIRVEESKLFEFDPPIGNKNLGNTCFFNSSLQALYFTKFFEDALSLLKVSAPNFQNLKLTKSVLELLEKKNVNHTQELRSVLNAVRNINNQFGRGTQEDSYELLNTLLGGILDELQNGDRTCKPIDVDSGVNGISLKNLFTGIFITIYVYDSCNDVEVDFEEFTTLSIPIADNIDQNFKKLPHRGLQTISSEDPRFDIEKGLAVLTQIEDYEESDLPCRVCNIEGTGKAYRRMLVFTPPPVLVIHIDRFKMNDFNRLTKNAQRLKYPRIFNMAKFCSVANTELSTNSLNYELYAVVVHSGALGGGHYYAYVNTTRMHDVEKWQEHLKRSPLDLEKLKSNVEEFLRKRHEFQDDSGQTEVCKVKDSWFYVSDESVCSASVDEVISHKDAYILFYEVH
ncbi:ubiquitin carboxyl-terminal hydrolase 16-like isoform X4 [Saccostrea cucullata]|uniref:ubiquitin carboxyl-terminal hydrolase 16-like isoform X4 n=1 Tax=Saccostrea cuccullata TaxID=36930 RepID=UPI002ED01E3D